MLSDAPDGLCRGVWDAISRTSPLSATSYWGTSPFSAAEAQIYQRLLAMDQLEAQNRCQRTSFLKVRSLVELYDSVLIPALSMAEQDRHKGAIDATREEFLFLSINEIIAEFSAESERPDDAASGRRLTIRCYHRIVLCLPGVRSADEIIAAMLARILEQKGFADNVLSLCGSSVRCSRLSSIEARSRGDVVCISALPPRMRSPRHEPCASADSRSASRNSRWWCVSGDSSGDTARKPWLALQSATQLRSPVHQHRGGGSGTRSENSSDPVTRAGAFGWRDRRLDSISVNAFEYRHRRQSS